MKKNLAEMKLYDDYYEGAVYCIENYDIEKTVNEYYADYEKQIREIAEAEGEEFSEHITIYASDDDGQYEVVRTDDPVTWATVKML